MSSPKPAPGNARILVFDDVGLLGRITVEQAERALKRGEIELHEELPGRARLRPQPIRTMNEAEKREWRLKQERLKR